VESDVATILGVEDDAITEVVSASSGARDDYWVDDPLIAGRDPVVVPR
jgi:hypothetical protein